MSAVAAWPENKNRKQGDHTHRRRNGKHKTIVTRILHELEGLNGDECLKIPLLELPDSKVNIRSALNRATHKLKKSVSTAAADKFLYVWNS